MKKLGKKNKKKKLIIIGVLIVLLIAIVVAVLFLTKSKTPMEIDKTKEETPVEEVKKLNIVDLNSTSRPYAVVINNINAARSVQSGLQDAYIIYEFIVEGGITRYLALYLDQNTARIGSIRSARHYFLDYVLESDAILVHHGQSPQAQSDFTTLGIDRIVADNSNTGWRDKTLNLSSEHTLFTSIEKLSNGLGSIRQTRNKDLLLDYSVDTLDYANLEGSTVANNIKLTYSTSYITSYTYNSENGYYERSVNGTSHTDYVTKEQYHFKNIIVYQVTNYDLNDGSGKGRQGLNNIGSGDGYYISNGVSTPIKWEKTSRDSQTKYTLANGEELKVNDGNTFIQIVPTSGKVEISE